MKHSLRTPLLLAEVILFLAIVILVLQEDQSFQEDEFLVPQMPNPNLDLDGSRGSSLLKSVPVPATSSAIIHAIPTVVSTPSPKTTATPASTVTPVESPIPTDTPSELPTTAPISTPIRSPTMSPTPTIARVAVPSVGGMSYDQAERTLARAGFTVMRQDDWSQAVPADVVYAQSPAPGQALPAGGLVTLTVSKGSTKVTVPDIKGKKEEEAKQALVAAGLRVDPFIYYDSTAAAAWTCRGCVTSTTPDPGTLVDPGHVVKIAVRR